ncbi:MAG: hypothetical protein AAF340_10285 [Pseudomonadota bacterium]
MIQIERDPTPAELDPNKPNSLGQRELNRLESKLANGEVLTSDDFRAYGHDNVRAALRDMFNGKCAYCERLASGGEDGDIEHYRPKKGVSEADDVGVVHEGYWWLAMDWLNLVLSCKHCNQWRSKQVEIPDDVITIEQLEAFFLNDPRATGSGKQNSFPTQDNVWVTTRGDVSPEKPLILDPSNATIDPEDHLDWVIFEGASTVRPKNGSEAGEATRKILGLNRRWLEEERRAKIALMQMQRNRIIERMQKWLDTDDPGRKADLADDIDDRIEDLWVFTNPNQPFIGLARAFIRKLQIEVAELQDATPD